MDLDRSVELRMVGNLINSLLISGLHCDCSPPTAFSILEMWTNRSRISYDLGGYSIFRSLAQPLCVSKVNSHDCLEVHCNFSPQEGL